MHLSEALRASLAAGLPAAAAVANPVDMLASAPPEHYRRTVELVAASGEVDAVIAIFIPPLATTPVEVAAAVREAAADSPVPVLSVLMSAHDIPRAPADGVQIPTYRFPGRRRPRAGPRGHLRRLAGASGGTGSRAGGPSP